MSNVHASVESFCKIYLHCTKYPYLSVFGILLGEENDSSIITNAIPLFHGPFLAPMFETAMKLVSYFVSLREKKMI